VLAILATSALVASACSKTHTTTPLTPRQSDIRSTDTNVPFTDCGASCTGTIDGAKYAIKLPKQWNGTLLLFSHGYRFASPLPPLYTTIDTNAQVSETDHDGSGTDALSQKLLSMGYALAGSAYSSNGWAVGDGVSAGKALYDTFVKTVGKPRRTYVWGVSLGGLITEILAERYPNWVDGAAPFCGALAGPTLNFDLAFDVAFGIKTLIDPTLKLTNYASAREAADTWKQAAGEVEKAAADTKGGGTARILYIAALVDAPTQTETFDGHDAVSQVKARVEMLLTALAFGTVGRYELEHRVGGNVSDNSKTDYAARISAGEAAVIGLVKGDTVGSMDAKLARASRVKADPTAVNRAEALGDTSGKVVVPTVTLHTTSDPLVIVQNEYVLAQRAQQQGQGTNLVEAFVAPPASYSESTGAPYGAGHCRFNSDQQVGVLSALDQWVRTGSIPLPDAMSKYVGAGYAFGYIAPAWPAPLK